MGTTFARYLPDWVSHSSKIKYMNKLQPNSGKISRNTSSNIRNVSPTTNVSYLIKTDNAWINQMIFSTAYTKSSDSPQELVEST